MPWCSCDVTVMTHKHPHITQSFLGASVIIMLYVKFMADAAKYVNHWKHLGGFCLVIFHLAMTSNYHFCQPEHVFRWARIMCLTISSSPTWSNLEYCSKVEHRICFDGHEPNTRKYQCCVKFHNKNFRESTSQGIKFYLWMIQSVFIYVWKHDFAEHKISMTEVPLWYGSIYHILHITPHH